MIDKPKLLIIINRLVISGQSPDTISLAWHLKEDFDIINLSNKELKNIFYDKNNRNNNFSFLKHKQEGLTNRFKLRLRTYLDNPNSPLDFWNLELKIKNNTRVKKRKMYSSV